jgi:ABC-type glycerol-3-phosphate transport system substrate-binding protein
MRKGSVVLLALAAVAVAIVATTAQAKAKKATVSGTVTLSGWTAGPDEDALLQQVVNVFMKTHPTIKVNYSVINGDYTVARPTASRRTGRRSPWRSIRRC